MWIEDITQFYNFFNFFLKKFLSQDFFVYTPPHLVKLEEEKMSKYIKSFFADTIKNPVQATRIFPSWRLAQEKTIEPLC